MTPAYRTYALHYPVSALRKGGRIRRFRLEHLREENGAFVCAEGESKVYTLPASTTDLFCANNRLFAYLKGTQKGRFLDTNIAYDAGGSMHSFAGLVEADGTWRYFVIGNSYFYYFSNSENTIVTFSPTPSTTALALHHERLFGAVGTRVYYTKPLDFRGWQQYGEHDAGYFDLLPGAGDVVDIIAMRDRVYFLRKYGITCLTGYCDIYNFRQEALPFGMGEVLSRAAVIGEYAYFFTSRGLCRFDGTDAEHVEDASDEEISLVFDIRMGVANFTQVAASVTLTDGTTAVYIYDPVQKRGRFIRRSFEKCAFGNNVYTMRGGSAYRLTGKALPSAGTCKLVAEFALTDLGEGEKRLEAVRISGNGTFSVTAAGEEDAVTVSVAAGDWVRLPAAVRGEDLTLTVSTGQSAAVLRCLDLRVRREDRI